MLSNALPTKFQLHGLISNGDLLKDIELLCVAARPNYLTRELLHVIVMAVYIPPSANKNEATDSLLRAISNQQAATLTPFS